MDCCCLHFVLNIFYVTKSKRFNIHIEGERKIDTLEIQILYIFLLKIQFFFFFIQNSHMAVNCDS